MSEQTNEDELIEERIYNKVAAKIQDEMNYKMGDIQSQLNQIDERVEKMELKNNNTKVSTTNNSDPKWFCVGSDGAVATSAPSEDDPSIFQLSEDLYSILATASWSSFSFWISTLVIVGFQYLLVILLLTNQVDINSLNDNPLNIPANVETSVRISQVLLITIALFSQRDLLDSMESLVRGLPDHFCGDSHFANVTILQWRLSSIVRLIQGLLNFLASFVLAVQSDNVPDVLLNVLGVAFISDLDESAFRLCTKGYFGGSMKTMSKEVCEVRFHRTGTNIGMSTSIVKKKIKKDAHIISAFAIFLAGLVAFIYLAVRQDIGDYTEQDIRIEFGDEVLPFLGLFNGCYKISESRKDNAGRLVYKQVGYPNGGRFGFCSDFGDGDGGWTFYIGDKQDDDEICDSYILRSGETSTFSLLEAGTTKWYTYDDLPLDYLEITESKAPTTECGQSMFNSTKDACPSIEAFDTMHMTKLSPSVKIENLDASVTHPIYWSNSTEDGTSYTLIFFTGRRWIRTKSDHIQGLGNETSVSEIEDFFFSYHGLSKFIAQIRTLVDEEAELVSAVSEIVDTARDQGSPLGLLWYEPRYKEKLDNATETETDKLQRNFPSANLARPIDSVLTCLVCNNETNPCFNDGDCNPGGTCVCKYGETGDLCQVLPLGNGICNLRYNKEEYNYDGGDCCAGTCAGGDCGQDDLPDPFVDIAGDATSAGWYSPFEYWTEEWLETFREQEFAYGVDISEHIVMNVILGDTLRRFGHCIDTNTALLVIEQNLTPFQVQGYEEKIFYLAGTTVRCDGTFYLQTPIFNTNTNRPKDIFKEEVRVPYGARCTVGFLTTPDVPGDYVDFSIFAENQSTPFLQEQFQDGKTVVSFHIPESQCVWDTLVENRISPVFFDSEYEAFARGVDLDLMCAQDRGEVLERYAIWKISKSLTGGDISQNFGGHVCDININGTSSDDLDLLCSDNRRVSYLAVQANSFPSDVVSLTKLTTLAVRTENNNLTMSLPAGIGRLTLLTNLTLSDNQFAQLPSEIGSLTFLEILDLSLNNLTSLPPKIGSLASLKELHLSDNQLTSLPPEIGGLASLTDFALSYNDLTSLPSDIGRLTSLMYLDLWTNALTSLPSEIGNLESLELFYLDYNKLTSLPPEMGNLASLEWLSLYYNPMTWDSLPKEVQDLQLQGTQIDVCSGDGGFHCL